jgi:hypothetical protein
MALEGTAPEWRPREPWDQNVSSYAIDDGERLLLFDPIAPPSEIEKLATERDTAVVLTAPWAWVGVSSPSPGLLPQKATYFCPILVRQ